MTIATKTATVANYGSVSATAVFPIHRAQVGGPSGSWLIKGADGVEGKLMLPTSGENGTRPGVNSVFADTAYAVAQLDAIITALNAA